MVRVLKIVPRGFGANCYVLTADDKRAIVIDPASARIVEELRARGLQAEYVLLTHSHFDHIGGVPDLVSLGAKVAFAEAELPAVGTLDDTGALYGYPPFALNADLLLKDGQTYRFSGIDVKVLLTPGHTVGSVCFLVEEDKLLFTGDTLFEGSIGRTDFPTGSLSAMRESLRKLSALEGEYTVYAGHGEDTTLVIERHTNPFMIDA